MLDLSYIISDMKTNTDNRTEERKNRFNGQSFMLTKEEARRHDCIFLAEIMATLEDKTLGTGGSKHWDIMREHLTSIVAIAPRREALETPIKVEKVNLKDYYDNPYTRKRITRVDNA